MMQTLQGDAYRPPVVDVTVQLPEGEWTNRCIEGGYELVSPRPASDATQTGVRLQAYSVDELHALAAVVDSAIRDAERGTLHSLSKAG